MLLNTEASSEDQSRDFHFSLVAARGKGQRADSTGNSVHPRHRGKSTAEEHAFLLHAIPVNSYNSC